VFTTFRHAGSRLRAILGPLTHGEERRQIFGLGISLIGLLVLVTWLNVRNSYVNNAFMTALADGEPALFTRYILEYAAVFIIIAAIASVQRFVEEWLGLKMRENLTQHVMSRYLTDHSYHRLIQRDDIDNPDQRIAEDIKSFTVNSLSFGLIVLNSTVNLVSFAGVLWSISPRLVLAAVGYAALGTVGSIFLGRRLVPLNFLQLKKEGDFRLRLIQVREEAEAIALQSAETREVSRLNDLLKKVLDNFQRIINVNLRLNVFVNSFNYLTQIVPVLVVAPLFFNKEVSFGAITQSMAAFAFVLNAFTVIVTQFQQITSLAAVTERLGSLIESIEERPTEVPQIVHSEDGRVAFENVTLWTPHSTSPLIEKLNFELPTAHQLLIAGTDRESRAALFQAMAGLWEWGTGQITRPGPGKTMFLPSRPVLTHGQLRDQVTQGLEREDWTDDEITRVLEKVGLANVLSRFGGLDAQRDWLNELTASEQRLLAFARLFLVEPKFAIIDTGSEGVTGPAIRSLYGALSAAPTRYITFGIHPALREFHHSVIELDGDGSWSVATLSDAERR
jgi:putative ATP-binding cassette transporter